MINIEDYRSLLKDKNGLVFPRRELIEMGLTGYVIHKLVLLGDIEKIARGEYKVTLKKKGIEEVQEEAKDRKVSNEIVSENVEIPFLIPLTDEEVYDYVEKRNYQELEQILLEEKNHGTFSLTRLKLYVLSLMKTMRFVQQFGIKEEMNRYEKAESDYFGRFFEAFRKKDIKEAYRHIDQCIRFAREPLEFQIYKMMYDDIFVLNEEFLQNRQLRQDRRAIKECRVKRVSRIANKDSLTIDQIEEIREITNTILNYLDKMEEDTTYENYILGILDMLVLSLENPTTNLSFSKKEDFQEPIEQFKEALQCGDYETSYMALGTMKLGSQEKSLSGTMLKTYKCLLSILFQMEKAKEVIPTSTIKEVTVEEFNSVEEVYLNQLRILKEYIEKENYIGALHYYIAHGFREDYLFELILLCKENYDQLDGLKNIFDSLFIEENPNLSTVLQFAEIYKDTYIRSVEGISFVNQAKQEEIIDRMEQKIKQFR